MGEGISEFSFESIPMPDCTLPHLTAADSLAVTEHVLLCILKVFLSLYSIAVAYCVKKTWQPLFRFFPPCIN